MKDFKTTKDIREEFVKKYVDNEFRIIGNERQQSKTIEIQNAHFLADAPKIIREPNYKYFFRELEWYRSQSLNVNDIPGGAPKMWAACASKTGKINSNYGWCIFSEDNGHQFDHCLQKLLDDRHTREAIMIYDRPSMQEDYRTDGMHDFMCCQNVQYFINERDGEKFVDCIVNFRSNDAVFGYCNDYLWMSWVLETLAANIHIMTRENINAGYIWWNAGSLHVYERHFNYLEALSKS